MKLRVPFALLLALALQPLHAQAATEADEPQLAASERPRDLLVAENFDTLDQMAQQFRTEKTRVKGGDWKLALFYHALDRPLADDPDSVAHLEHLRHWMAERPESITARVALAISLHRWAWVARGNGESNTVTPEMWAKFETRSHEADVVLDSAKGLKQMDPEWFSQKFAVALAEGWTVAQMKDIVDRCVAYEPDWFYIYRSYANAVLPKWYGEPGDAAKFAQRSADRVGGSAGDELYYRIATVLVKRGDGNFPAETLDWARIQRGYAAIAQNYGLTNHHKNQLAYMAWKEHDRAVALAQFALIGDHYSSSVWRDRKYFDRARDWANQHETWPAVTTSGR